MAAEKRLLFNEHPYLIEPYVYASMHRYTYASIVYSTVQSLETTAAFTLFAIGTNVSAYVYTVVYAHLA